MKFLFALREGIVRHHSICCCSFPGDKEIDYDPQFRFYITTKLMNPHYVPEIASRACIVNFMVKEQGLESQLLGIVVRKEKPQLEEMKDNLVVNIAAGKKKLEELEDLILR